MTLSLTRIGLISDTHGLLRPEALDALQGSDFIVHAGDIGPASVIEQLASIAPVTAVGGNNDDSGAWPEQAELRVGAKTLFVLHQLAHLRPAALPDPTHVIVYGHSHQPAHEWRAGTLVINPGSAGPRRFKLPVSLARLTIAGDRITHEFVRLIA